MAHSQYGSGTRLSGQERDDGFLCAGLVVIQRDDEKIKYSWRFE